MDRAFKIRDEARAELSRTSYWRLRTKILDFQREYFRKQDEAKGFR